MKITITIDYGSDSHSMEMNDVTYAAIKSGQKVTLEGQSFLREEDGKVLDHWVFSDTPGDIYFWRPDDSARLPNASVATRMF